MKSFLTSLFFLLLSSAVFAQDTISTEQIVEPVQEPKQEQVQEPTQKSVQKPPWKDKLYFGGYVNFSFGKYTLIGIEPMLGYKLTPKLSTGIKIRYDYISDKRYSDTHTTSNYGGSLFARLRLLKRIYLHAEYAGYNYELYNEFGESDRKWIPFLFVGAGLSQRVGKRSTLNAQIVFDVLNSSKSPYKNWEPFYSVGVGVGF